MGYRSDVALAIKTEFIPDLIKENKNITTPEIKMLLERSDNFVKEDATLYHWNYIKWYGDDVDALISNLYNINSENWYFIELGEDIDDNKLMGAYYDNPFDLGYVREIRFDK